MPQPDPTRLSSTEAAAIAVALRLTSTVIGNLAEANTEVNITVSITRNLDQRFAVFIGPDPHTAPFGTGPDLLTALDRALNPPQPAPDLQVVSR